MAHARTTCMTRLTPAPLTTEERDILYLTVTGHSPAQSARLLNLTLPEAQRLLAQLLRRVDVPDRTALVIHAIVNCWV